MPEEQPSEVILQDLVEKAQKGDHRAYDRLKKYYADSLNAYCQKFLRHHQDAEDTVQEIFVRAWQHLPRYQPLAPFDHWLIRIAHHLCLNARRGKREALEWKDFIFLPDPQPQPSDVVIKEAFHECVWKNLENGLTTEEFLICRLYYQKSMTINEIADLLGKPPGTINATLQRKIKPALRAAGKACNED